MSQELVAALDALIKHLGLELKWKSCPDCDARVEDYLAKKKQDPDSPFESILHTLSVRANCDTCGNLNCVPYYETNPAVLLQKKLFGG